MTGVRGSAAQAPVKKSTARKAPAKQAAGAKTASAEKVAPAKEAAAAKAPGKKAAPVKAAAKKVASAEKAAPAKAASAKKEAPSKAAPAKTPAKKAAAEPASADGRLTKTELRTIRTQLAAEHDEMQAEYDRSVIALNDLQQTNSDGAGDDQADAGSKTFDREQEQSITANRQDLLRQIERALERIDAGTYGLCENCGKPIPKARLQALPMATLDAACKVREERH